MNHRRIVFRFLAALGAVALGLGTVVLRAQDGVAKDEEIRQLIEQLAAENFEARKAATSRLWEFGNAALPALREAAKSDDPEISLRARKILEDLKLGIFADTPVETVRLIREYHGGGPKEKESVLRRLAGSDKTLVRLRLIVSEKDAVLRIKFVKEYAGTGDALLAALRESGEEEAIEELLAIISPRDWATYVLLEGRAEAELAKLRIEWDEGNGQGDPSRLVWLLLVSEKQAEARAVAEKAADEGLRREVYLREGDWQALVEMEDPVIGDNAVENLGFRAFFFKKAGQEAKAAEAIGELAKLEIEDDYMARNRAVSLMILDRLDLAAKSFAQQGELDSHEMSFHLERLDVERLFARLGVDPSGQGAAKAIEKRVAEALKLGDAREGRNARRELFYLCRSLGDLFGRLGEKEEARGVFRAARELVQGDAPFLSFLASSCRRAGLEEEADTIGVEAMEAGAGVTYLSSRFPGQRAMANLWWDYCRSERPEEEVRDTLKRVLELLDPAEDEVAGDVTAQVGELVKWIGKQKEDEQAKYFQGLGEFLRDREDWAGATDHFRRQSELSKKKGAPLIEAGDMFARQKRWNEAAELYAEAAKVEPENELAVYLHGHALVMAGENEKGESLKADAVRMPLANSMRRNQLANGLLKRELPEAARDQWRFLLKSAAHDGWDGMEFWALRTARVQLVSSMAKGDPARAADLLEGYLMSFLMTNSTMTTRYYLIYKARIHGLRFEASLAAGKVDEAIAHARRALDTWPGSTKFVIVAGERLNEAGKEEVADEFHEALEQRFEKILKRFPNSARDHNSLGWLAGKSGRKLDLALVHAEAAVKLKPDEPEYLDTLAEVSFRLGDRSRAIELAKRCLELDPGEEQYQEQLKRFEAN